MDGNRFSTFFLSCVSFPIYFQILSCLTLLQFARVSIPLQAPVLAGHCFVWILQEWRLVKFRGSRGSNRLWNISIFSIKNLAPNQVQNACCVMFSYLNSPRRKKKKKLFLESFSTSVPWSIYEVGSRRGHGPISYILVLTATSIYDINECHRFWPRDLSTYIASTWFQG